MNDIPYTEPTFNPPPKPVHLEEITGYFPQVSSAPTWTPKTFKGQFAVYKNGSTYRLYVYDTANAAWRYTALT